MGEVECVDPVSISPLVGDVSYSTLKTGASGTGRRWGISVV